MCDELFMEFGSPFDRACEVEKAIYIREAPIAATMEMKNKTFQKPTMSPCAFSDGSAGPYSSRPKSWRLMVVCARGESEDYRLGTFMIWHRNYDLSNQCIILGFY